MHVTMLELLPHSASVHLPAVRIMVSHHLLDPLFPYMVHRATALDSFKGSPLVLSSFILFLINT